MSAKKAILKMPRSRSELMTTLIDDVAKLTKAYDHEEPMDNGKTHLSRHEGLLQQLWVEINESTPAPDPEGSSRSSSARSKPPMSEELLGYLIQGQKLAISLVMMSGGKLATNTAENYWQLPNLMINATDELVDHVSGQVAYYKNQLELILTWKEEPRRIPGACPMCDMKHAIIIQMDRHGPISAKCVKCHAEWDKTKLGVLAGSLKYETPER